MRIICCVSLLLAVSLAGCGQGDDLLGQLERSLEKPGLDIVHQGQSVEGWKGFFVLEHDDEFVYKIWHQHPGTVHNGVLRVQVTSLNINKGEPVSRVFSFDAWPPNKENAQTFKFPIGGQLGVLSLGSSLQIQFDVKVQTEETEEFTGSSFWTTDGWSEEELPEAELVKRLIAANPDVYPEG